MNNLTRHIINTSLSTKKSYRIVTLITAILFFAFHFSVFSVFVSDSVSIKHVTFRVLAEVLLFVVVCHFFIRTYLKIKVIHYTLSWGVIWPLLTYLALVSAVYLGLSVLLSKVEVFKFSDVSEMQFINDDGALDFKLSQFDAYIIAFFNCYSILFVWSVVYLFWLQHLSRVKMKKQMHQAQIQQLTNQLNPHFLFNAFNSIRALIYEDQDKAADTVTQLSELFRTHLQAHLKAQSTLADEWQVATRYLAIESIRLEERLRLSVELDDELLQQNMPTLTLLTLVENAIKHGVSPNSEGGTISVVAAKESSSKWRLSVINSVKAQSQADGTQTGIVNIKKRLTLMFGSAFTWQQTQQDNQFIVEMELPLDKSSNR